MRNVIDRPQSRGEEIANSVSHGVALLMAIVAVSFLIVTDTRHLGTANILGISIFAATMVMLYMTSTLYHALPEGRAKCTVLKLDHGAIYFFIAGSYTPFALGVLSKPEDLGVLGLVWLFAIIGATLKACDRLSHPWLSTALYVVMGWLVLIAAVPIVKNMPMSILLLLVSGGAAYTVGVIFFVLDSRFRYSHAVWHCFVVAGSSCHCIAVLSFVA